MSDRASKVDLANRLATQPSAKKGKVQQVNNEHGVIEAEEVPKTSSLNQYRGVFWFETQNQKMLKTTKSPLVDAKKREVKKADENWQTALKKANLGAEKRPDFDTSDPKYKDLTNALNTRLEAHKTLHNQLLILQDR